MTNATFADAIIGTNLPAPVDTAKPNSIAITVKPAPRTHRVEPGTVAATSNNFDLMDFIETINSAYVATRVATSTAWRIDVSIVSAARSIYKLVRDDIVNQGLDERAEVVNALNMQAFAEQSFHEIGSAVTGPVATIKALHFQRDQWHDLASAMTQMTSDNVLDRNGQPVSYQPKSLEDLIFNPGNMKVSGDTRRKMKLGSVRKAEALGSPELAEQLFQKQLERAGSKAEDMAQIMKNQAQGVSFMLDAALHYSDSKLKSDEIPQGEITEHFESLPIDIQRVLIDNAISAAQRAEEWAADDRFITESEYDSICISSLKAVADLKTVLKTPKFKVQQQQADASVKMLG